MTLLTYKGRKHLPVYKKQTGKNRLHWSAYTGSRPLFSLRTVAVRGNKQLARAKKVAFKW